MSSSGAAVQLQCNHKECKEAYDQIAARLHTMNGSLKSAQRELDAGHVVWQRLHPQRTGRQQASLLRCQPFVTSQQAGIFLCAMLILGSAIEQSGIQLCQSSRAGPMHPQRLHRGLRSASSTLPPIAWRCAGSRCGASLQCLRVDCSSSPAVAALQVQLEQAMQGGLDHTAAHLQP